MSYIEEIFYKYSILILSNTVKTRVVMSKSRGKHTTAVPPEKQHVAPPSTGGLFANTEKPQRELIYAVIEGDSSYYSGGREFKAAKLLQTIMKRGIPRVQFFTSEEKAFEWMKKLKKEVAFTILELYLLPSQCNQKYVVFKDDEILSLRGFGPREDKYIPDGEVEKMYALKPK